MASDARKRSPRMRPRSSTNRRARVDGVSRSRWNAACVKTSASASSSATTSAERGSPSKNPTSEEVAGHEHANALGVFVGWHENLERAARDEEEAAIQFAPANGELARRVQPCLGVFENDLEIRLVAGRRHLTASRLERLHMPLATRWCTWASTRRRRSPSSPRSAPRRRPDSGPIPRRTRGVNGFTDADELVAGWGLGGRSSVTCRP